MPDPISSFCPFPNLSSEAEPPLACQSASEPPLSANACTAPEAEADSSNSDSIAAQKLASQYLRADYSKLIAAEGTESGSAQASSQTFFATRHGLGDQFQPELGASRTHLQGTVDGVHLNGTLDLLTAGLHLGSLNDDGSRGENVGAGATLVGLEVTAEYHGYSFTFGESLSLGAGVSSGGERDVDGDGVRERCFKGSLGPLTLGFCDEL